MTTLDYGDTVPMTVLGRIVERCTAVRAEEIKETSLKRLSLPGQAETPDPRRFLVVGQASVPVIQAKAERA